MAHSVVGGFVYDRERNFVGWVKGGRPGMGGGVHSWGGRGVSKNMLDRIASMFAIR